MNETRWNRLTEIFLGALDLPAEAREQYLQGACGDDGDLLAEVKAMLGADNSARGQLEEVLAQAHGDMDRSEVCAGRMLGPYLLVREIGAGGMGTVYHGIRSDGEFVQAAAIKVIKRGMDSDSILRRFRQERQILARLEHPNIARLLDGGSTPSGQPYFVMEYVDGVPLTEYAEAGRLSVDERLRLFLAVCDAVQTAHRNLIVHRDLKPGNILVRSDGVPKLLDFGIAKLLDSDLATETAPATATGVRLLTPEYASPEQVRGEPVSTATDVYSLGAVLYELLTGRKPHGISTQSPVEIERAICITEPSRPSTVTGNRLLAGDLDNIVLMAMRKQASRRYASADQLAEDIRRYLGKQPVRARPDTALYRTRKFVRRNRTLVAAAAVVAMTLAGGLLSYRYQAQRAERRFQQVRQLANTFLFDFHNAIETLPGSTPAREMVVRTALQYLDQLSAEARGDAALQLDLAAAYLKVGDVQGDPRRPNLGQTKPALESYYKAITLASDVMAQTGDTPPALRLLAQAHNKAGDVELRLKGTRRAIDQYQRGLQMHQRLASSGHRAPRDEDSRVSLLNTLGDAQIDSGELENAYRNYKDALDRTLASPRDERTDGGIVICRIRVGYALFRLGRLHEALTEYANARMLAEELLAREPRNSRHPRVLTAVYQRMGHVLGNPEYPNLGRVREAADLYRKAAAIGEKLVAADPKNAQAKNGLAYSYQFSGVVLADSDPGESARAWRSALALRRELSAADPNDLDARQACAVALVGLGRAHGRSGGVKEAEAFVREALSIEEAVLAGDPQRTTFRYDLARAHLVLGELLMLQGRKSEAAEHYHSAAEQMHQGGKASTDGAYQILAGEIDKALGTLQTQTAPSVSARRR